MADGLIRGDRPLPAGHSPPRPRRPTRKAPGPQQAAVYRRQPSPRRNRPSSGCLLSPSIELIFALFAPPQSFSRGTPTASAEGPERALSCCRNWTRVLAAFFRRLLHLYLSLSLIYDLSAPVDTVFHTAYIVELHCNIR